MSRLAPWLFSCLQAAPFYCDWHRYAVELLSPGRGASWLDVGSGPGLVARQAARHGYRVTASDADPAMLAMARGQPGAAQVALYRQATLASLQQAGATASVVSAASLLAVLPDRAQALSGLLACVAPGGALLLIETTAAMRPMTVLRYLWQEGVGGGRLWLLPWALVRRGRSVLPALVVPPGWQVARHELPGGFLAAWVFRAAA